jgi:hypothetical protein
LDINVVRAASIGFLYFGNIVFFEPHRLAESLRTIARERCNSGACVGLATATLIARGDDRTSGMRQLFRNDWRGEVRSLRRALARACPQDGFPVRKWQVWEKYDPAEEEVSEQEEESTLEGTESGEIMRGEGGVTPEAIIAEEPEVLHVASDEAIDVLTSACKKFV